MRTRPTRTRRKRSMPRNKRSHRQRRMESGIADAKLDAALDKQTDPDPASVAGRSRSGRRRRRARGHRAQDKIDLAIPLVQPATDAKAATAAALAEATERAERGSRHASPLPGTIINRATVPRSPPTTSRPTRPHDNRFILADLEGTGGDAAKARSEGKAPFLDARVLPRGGQGRRSAGPGRLCRRRGSDHQSQMGAQGIRGYRGYLDRRRTRIDLWAGREGQCAGHRQRTGSVMPNACNIASR